MGNYVSRMMEEHRLLGIRLLKLNEFILSDKYDELPEIDRNDLKEQRDYMKSYMCVLSRRVSRQCGNA